MSWSIQSELPGEWTFEVCRTYGVIVTAVEGGRQQGSVTVDEDKRSFALGIALVRTRGAYSGRGWKASLYQDAVKSLQEALS